MNNNNSKNCIKCNKKFTIDNFINLQNCKETKCCLICRNKINIFNKINNNKKCRHGLRPTRCKICYDKVKITIINMVYHSKESDKKFNRKYNNNDFITTKYLHNLVGDPNNLYCAYYFCDTKLNFDKSNPAMATIERINNDLAHIKSNCVLACRTCNYKKLGDKLNLKNKNNTIITVVEQHQNQNQNQNQNHQNIHNANLKY